MKRSAYLKSSDKKNRIHVEVWRPEGKVKAVLQIVHGMFEHIGRYDEFASFLSANGIAVVGADMLGHGKTAANREDLGYFASTNGKTYILKDAHRVSVYAKAVFPDVPLFILGHSMGSFIVRSYITRWGNDIDGAIIMGTGDISASAGEIGRFISYQYITHFGARSRSKLLYFLALGANSMKFRLDKGGSWLSSNEDSNRAHKADPLCDFNFTSSAYHTLFTLVEELGRRSGSENIPKSLSIFIVSGSDDPLNAGGKAVLRVYNSLVKQGIEDIDVKIYQGDRHELLNEMDRDVVYRDILYWISERI